MYALPLKIEAREKRLLEKLGFVFLNEPFNSVQQKVLPPLGWTSKIMNHYWTHLLDEKSRERVMVFCKLEIWDASSHCHIVNSITFSSKVIAQACDIPGKEEWSYVCEIKKHGLMIHQTEPLIDFAGIKADEAAKEWLRTNYPEWENPLAYWD